MRCGFSATTNPACVTGAAEAAPPMPDPSAIFGGSNQRPYSYQRVAELGTTDRFARFKAEYDAAGGNQSNLRYGCVLAG